MARRGCGWTGRPPAFGGIRRPQCIKNQFHEDDPVFFQEGLRLTCRCDEKIGDKVFHDPPETCYTTYVWLYQWPEQAGAALLGPVGRGALTPVNGTFPICTEVVGKNAESRETGMCFGLDCVAAGVPQG